MTAIGDLLGLARTTQAITLVSENVKVAKQSLKKKKKLNSKKLISLATKNIVGTQLIKTQAQLSAGL